MVEETANPANGVPSAGGCGGSSSSSRIGSSMTTRMCFRSRAAAGAASVPPAEPCPSSECGDLPPGRRSFPASVGINPDAHPCGWNQHPSTSFGDRIFVAGSSKRGPFVCCNVSSPLRNPSAKPGAGYCKVGADGAVGCWWPISAHPPLQPKPGCPNVDLRTVCPVSTRCTRRRPCRSRCRRTARRRWRSL